MSGQYVIKRGSDDAARLHELIHELGEGDHADFTIYVEKDKLVFMPREWRDNELFEKIEKLTIDRRPRHGKT